MSQKPAFSRRNFLRILWGGLSLAALAELGGLVLAFFWPRRAKATPGQGVLVGPVADFPSGSTTVLPDTRACLVRLSDGGFLALYRRCTHLGCSVPWTAARGQFVCPCHGSVFDIRGEVVSPPAPRPLDLLPVTIAEGQVWIDPTRPQPRTRFETNQVTYA